MTSRHELIAPDSLAPAIGFSHAVAAAPGRVIYLGGQTAHDSQGRLVAGGIVEQFDAAAANVVTALGAAGAEPHDLVSLHIFVTDAVAYRAAVKELGAVYRRHFGRHYPAVALFEVTALFDPAASVELVGVAVVPGS